MSELSEAFEETLDAQSDAYGSRLKVNIRGKDIEAIILEQGDDPLAIAGGMADQGTFTVHVLQSAMPHEPKLHEPITANGRSMKVLRWIDRNGIAWEITAGVPEA